VHIVLPRPSATCLRGQLSSNVRPHTNADTPVSMQVAAYEPTDAHELVNMWRASFEYGVGITDPNPIQDQLAFFLSEVVPKNEVTVVKDAGIIIGFSASVPESVCHSSWPKPSPQAASGYTRLHRTRTHAASTNTTDLQKSSASQKTCTSLRPSNTRGSGARVRPNPSLKRSANGRPPGPGRRYVVHFRQPGPGVLPSSPA
jgi:hypothetical protein